MSVDLNQTISDASLDNLHDIIVPEAIGFFPMAEGWVALLLVLLSLLFHFVWKGWCTYKAKQYKREALAELQYYAVNSKENGIAMLSLAKRVAFVYYGRKDVAPLSENIWWDFMERHSKVQLSDAFRNTLAKLLYDKDYVLNNQEHERLKESIKVWIHTHEEDKNV